MPHRRLPPSSVKKASASGNFRKRFDNAEARRAQLIERLTALGASAQRNPAYKCAITLLNTTFRKAKLGQRFAVLESATWVIELLERLPFVL